MCLKGVWYNDKKKVNHLEQMGANCLSFLGEVRRRKRRKTFHLGLASPIFFMGSDIVCKVLLYFCVK